MADSQSSERRERTIDTNDGAALEREAAELGVSREALLKIIEIAGPRHDDLVEYVRRYGSPGTTA